MSQISGLGEGLSEFLGRPGFHLHIETGFSPVLGRQFDSARFHAAAAAYPGVCDGLDMTFGADPADFDRRLETCEVLFLAGGPDLSGLRNRAPRLRWIHSASAGVEGLVGSIPADLVLTNSAGVHDDRAFEFSMTALLMLNNRMPRFATAQRDARWAPAALKPIAGKKVVIVGLGAVGRAVARAAHVLKLRAVGVSRSGSQQPMLERVVSAAAIGEVLPHADFLVIAAPVTAETSGMIGRAELDLLPRFAGVVNIGRGPVMDYAALADKLARNELSGSVLDVFPDEPLPAESPFWSVPNLMIVPHCGLLDPERHGIGSMDLFFRNLVRYRQGQRLDRVVDVRRGY